FQGFATAPPLSPFQEKRVNFFTFTCPFREQSLLKNVPGHVKYASDRIGDKTQNGLFASADAV
ncbi:MAG: hypothetical protein IJC21_03155, partial [Lentisphaeria bacterium]|nr:hypothetical protein [Lentisphaeria bacterium]